ncbi:two component, sigma54 specific, Fis family transcriptional regulator [Novosphingobium nitrogenifigens DSM 19370]|uniref:Two component, sigma54 specific, Fis family transcriptional regulator n=1 Tax=Novosphingobium nitrogenifigens DSM 19370 TaxID=983920 RepID=F1Z3X1_9SPHN|nr:sigma-54 dependent transcriptional regulator [Novosphingobium nitrogenifigens]EGD60705.1 two component, sigma54 specific, Fis family transcriptional regulator [Novosphingobium nitrogenifigens DSM 19370]
MTDVRIALVDDDPDLRTALVQTMTLAGFAVDAFSGAQEALGAIDRTYPGVVVTDIRMPVIDGIALFQRLRDRDPDLPVIFMTGHGEVTMAVDAMKAGAWDFLTKPFAPETLVAAVRRAAETRRLALENRRLRQLAEDSADQVLVGEAPSIQRVRQTIAILGRSDIDILVEGESGTGKELVARLIHRAGDRARKPFVTIACPAVPDALIDTLLTGDAARPGKLIEAQGGTLLLDDIDRASPALQARLVQVLEERAVMPAHARAPVPLDVRIIATAGASLDDAMRAGHFPPALLYRLSGVRLSLPPVRERREDVERLFAHLLDTAASRLRRPPPPITGAMLAHLAAHDWPGNVREIAQYAERVVLQLEDDGPADTAPQSLGERMAEFEARLLREAFLAEGGDVNRTAARLAIPRETFYYKVKRHGLDLAALRRRI